MVFNFVLRLFRNAKNLLQVLFFGVTYIRCPLPNLYSINLTMYFSLVLYCLEFGASGESSFELTENAIHRFFSAFSLSGNVA